VLSAWWFDIATGNMYAYERGSRSFELIDRAVAERMVKRLAARAPARAEPPPAMP
jgi:carbonic anhydrase